MLKKKSLNFGSKKNQNANSFQGRKIKPQFLKAIKLNHFAHRDLLRDKKY